MEQKENQKFVPREKQSKKARRAENLKRRSTWGPLSPVTRKAESKKHYSRKRTRTEKDDSAPDSFFMG